MEKAKKFKTNVVNGIWLMELYLGNVHALNKQLEARYINLNVNHFAYDNSFVVDYMEQWKALIKLPIEKIKVKFIKFHVKLLNHKTCVI